jgi:hypothetical protein
MLAKLIFLGLNAIFNFILFLLLIFFGGKEISILFLYLTIINFVICTFYFCNRFIYEYLIYSFTNKNQEIQLEKIKNNKFFYFNNNILSKFSFSLCITVCQIYWLLLLGGKNLMLFPTNNFFIIFLGVYLHLIIGFSMVTDMYLLDIILYKEKYNRDFYILCIFQISYSIFLTTLAKINEKFAIYPFLKLDYLQLIAIYIIVLFSLRNSYDLYHYCHKRNKPKNKNINTNDNLDGAKYEISKILIDENLYIKDNNNINL